MSQPFSLTINPMSTAANPVTPLDLSDYIDVSQGSGLDPADPSFTDKVFSHSLLKEGGTLALEDLKIKEVVFPLYMSGPNKPTVNGLVETINDAINSAGAVAIWQDTGCSQPTYFDLVSGQVDIEYDYRRATGNQVILKGKLRLFAQPLARKASPRVYAVASGAGPLLLVGATDAIAALGGTSYFGTPTYGSLTLDGDAAAQVVATYSRSGINQGRGSIAAMSVLPDAGYLPMIAPGATFVTSPTQSVPGMFNWVGATILGASGAVASQYLHFTTTGGTVAIALPWSPTLARQAAAGTGPVIPPWYAGQHRVLALARTVGGAAPGTLELLNGFSDAPLGPTVDVPLSWWQLVDLGTLGVYARQQFAANAITAVLGVVAPSGGAVDVTALIYLPEASTTVFNPQAISGIGATYLINTSVDYDGTANGGAGTVTGEFSIDFSSYVRGAVPKLDPKYSPMIAFLGVPWTSSATAIPLNLNTSVSVSVLERTRYVFG